MVAAAVEKNRCLTTRYLASALAYLILLLGSFFTLIWGWNNSPVINAAAKHWFTARAIPLIADQPLSPNFDPADFFPFPKLKDQLAGLSFAQESLEKTWGGGCNAVTAETFASTLNLSNPLIFRIVKYEKVTEVNR